MTYDTTREMTRDEASGSSRVVRVPADVNRPDTLLAGLTARQLLILAAVAATRKRHPGNVADAPSGSGNPSHLSVKAMPD